MPFTSINYGLDTSEEGRMCTKYLLEILSNGIGKKKRTSIFPCGIFQVKKGINRKPGDPNYDLFKLTLNCTAKRLYPNYANCDWSVQINAVRLDRELKARVINNLTQEQKNIIINKIKEDAMVGYLLGLKIENNQLVVNDYVTPLEEMGTMGCRTWNGFDVNFEKDYIKHINTVINGGTLPEYIQTSGIQKDGRGNICPVTIILPELAMQAKQINTHNPTEPFMKLLADKINDAKDFLIERFEWMCEQSPKAAKFMYENNTMCGFHDEEGVRSALRHGTLVIGQLGLAECLQILIGSDHSTTPGLLLAHAIEQLYKDKCAGFKKEYNLNFGVYYSPSESLCFTAMKKFKDKWGIIPNVSDREYFTNSMHLPVWVNVTPFEKIDIESQLTGYSSAGCITYVELESSCKNNIEALEELVNYAMDKDIPYFAINVPNDQCMNCGTIDDLPDECPICQGHDIMRLRRVTGYLSQDYHHFNYGKQKEVEDRVEHNGAVL